MWVNIIFEENWFVTVEKGVSFEHFIHFFIGWETVQLETVIAQVWNITVVNKIFYSNI